MGASAASHQPYLGLANAVEFGSQRQKAEERGGFWVNTAER